MNPTPWPFPGDSPIVRARRVALAYRTALEAADPGMCAQVDDAMAQWGQHWVMPRMVYHDDDEWLAVADAADFAMVETSTLRMWRKRGVLSGRNTNGKWTYRAGDLVDLTSEKRRRGLRRKLADNDTDRPE